MKRIDLKLNDEQADVLRDMAKHQGFVIGRGKEADWGSVPQMIKAVADGDLLIVRNPQRESIEG